MAHKEQRDYLDNIKKIYLEQFNNKKVLDIGSLDINGSSRVWFENCEYIGVDVGPGKGVDIVSEGQNLDHPDNFYDVVLSFECFEHNPYWLETFLNMYRMLKSNGFFILSCATTGRQEHGTTKRSPTKSPLTIAKGWDYYKNLTENDFREKMNIDTMFEKYKFEWNNRAHDLYFHGFKKSL